MMNNENNKVIAFPGGNLNNETIGANASKSITHGARKVNKLKIIYLVGKKILSLKPIKMILGSGITMILVITAINIIPKDRSNISVRTSKTISFEEGFAQNVNSMSQESAANMLDASSREELAETTSTIAKNNVQNEEDIANVLSEDLIAILTPRLEGENCAYYLAEIEVVLPAGSMEYKDGEYSYNIKDVNFEVVDVKPDMAEDQIGLLPQDILEKIYEEAETLKKKVQKELKKSSGKKYLEEKINEELNTYN